MSAQLIIFGIILVFILGAAWSACEIAMRQVHGKNWRKDGRYKHEVKAPDKRK